MSRFVTVWSGEEGRTQYVREVEVRKLSEVDEGQGWRCGISEGLAYAQNI